MKLLVCILCTAFIVVMPCEGASLTAKKDKLSAPLEAGRVVSSVR